MGTAAENKALVQQIFSDSADRTGTSFVDLMADDVCWTIMGQASWAQTFAGKDAVLNKLQTYVGSLFPKRLRTSALNFIAEGDFVVVEAKGEGNVTKAGLAYDNDYCFVFRLENSRIKHIREYLDSDLVERVLGPWPSPKS